MHRIGRRVPRARREKSTDQGGTAEKIEFLAPLNKLVEEAWTGLQSAPGAQELRGATIPDSAWEQWLWLEDPLEEPHIDLLLNRMHLLGFIIARLVA